MMKKKPKVDPLKNALEKQVDHSFNSETFLNPTRNMAK
jgi:hypothetical protein